MHGAYTPQQTRQLVLADILQPLVESIAQNLVHTQESGKGRGEEGTGAEPHTEGSWRQDPRYPNTLHSSPPAQCKG